MTDQLDAQLRALAHALVDEAGVPTALHEREAEFRRLPPRVTRRAPVMVAIAAGLVVALVVGGALLLSAGNDPSSVQTAAGASGGCAGKAYVADQGDGTVSAITTATGEVSATIPVGTSNAGWPLRVAITPDGKHAYVTGGSNGTVSVIDTATDVVSATIDVGGGPVGVAITPDGRRAYVTNSSDPTVSVIDTATDSVSATIDVGGGLGVAITPDGKHAYVTGGSNGTVSVIETATGAVSASIDVGGGLGVAITPDGRHAYVTGTGFHADTSAPLPDPLQAPDHVSVIDTATGVVSATIPVGPNPGDVAITPDGQHVYVIDHPTGGGLGTVSVIDTATGQVSATVSPGRLDPQAVAITPDGKYAYVAGPDEYSYLPGKEDPAPDPLPIRGSVSVIDTATGVASATIPVGKSPGGVAICPS